MHSYWFSQPRKIERPLVLKTFSNSTGHYDKSETYLELEMELPDKAVSSGLLHCSTGTPPVSSSKLVDHWRASDASQANRLPRKEIILKFTMSRSMILEHLKESIIFHSLGSFYESGTCKFIKNLIHTIAWSLNVFAISIAIACFSFVNGWCHYWCRKQVYFPNLAPCTYGAFLVTKFKHAMQAFNWGNSDNHFGNRQFYSCVLSYLAFEWKWGCSWPCFDRNPTAFLMLMMLFSC